MAFKYIKNTAIITEYKRLVKKSRFNDKDLKAFIDEGIRKILTNGQKTFSIALIKIENHKVQTPKGFHSVTQFPLYLPPGNYTQDASLIDDMSDKGINLSECLCEKNTDDCPEKKWELKDYNCDNNCILELLLHPNFLSYKDYRIADTSEVNWEDNTAYKMRPRINNYSNMEFHIGSCSTIALNNSVIEYEFQDQDVMIVNIKDGYVLLSYLSHKLDENGYFLIPDNPYVTEALRYYLVEKEGLGAMLEKPADGHNKGMWRDFVTMLPRKMKAARSEMIGLEKDELEILLETSWNTHVYNRDEVGGYKPPIDWYPKY